MCSGPSAKMTRGRKLAGAELIQQKKISQLRGRDDSYVGSVSHLSKNSRIDPKANGRMSYRDLHKMQCLPAHWSHETPPVLLSCIYPCCLPPNFCSHGHDVAVARAGCGATDVHA